MAKQTNRQGASVAELVENWRSVDPKVSVRTMALELVVSEQRIRVILERLGLPTKTGRPGNTRGGKRLTVPRVPAEAYRLALRDGVLVRPDTCSACGAHQGDVGPIHGHHCQGRIEKPLVVVWLCVRCHYIAEGMLRAGMKMTPKQAAAAVRRARRE